MIVKVAPMFGHFEVIILIRNHLEIPREIKVYRTVIHHQDQRKIFN